MSFSKFKVTIAVMHQIDNSFILNDLLTLNAVMFNLRAFVGLNQYSTYKINKQKSLLLRPHLWLFLLCVLASYLPR
jgi:hypothetical protein